MEYSPLLNCEKDVPISALGQESRQWLSAMLDCKKVILSPSGYQRDWRGLSTLAKIPAQFYSTLESSEKSSTERVLRLWVQYPVPEVPATVAKLQDFLQLLDRWDVYEDTLPHIERDCDIYRANRAAVDSNQEPVNDLITYDDTVGNLRRYHAFILYAEADARFAQLMKNELNHRGYMTCTREDLLLGFTTTVEPITRLINERCEHVIVIYSPDFLSAENHFYMNFAQSISIKMHSRKIIPCMYRECWLPSQYTFMHMARYYEDESRQQVYNFWEKLTRSIDCSTLPRIEQATLATGYREHPTASQITLPRIRSVPSLSSVNPASSNEDVTLTLPSPPNEEPGEQIRSATSLLSIFSKRKNLSHYLAHLRARLKGKKKHKERAAPLVAA